MKTIASIFRAGLCGAALSMCAAEPVIRVVFPAAGSRVVTEGQTYVIGSVTPPDTPLIVNAQTVTPWRTGGFLFMADVTPGTNTLTLRAGSAERRHTFTVPFHTPSLPAAQTADISAFSSPRAYVVTGPLFETRARSLPGEGDAVAFLSPGMTLLGDGRVGAHTRVWLDGAHCFVETRHLADYRGETMPCSDTRPPDITQGFGPHPPRGKKPADLLIVLDPGHGGPSAGAVGPTGVTEKEVNLKQAFAIRDALKEAGFRVRMTRETDVDMDLYARARFAYEAKADAFISIHHNATAPQTDPRQVRHISSYAWNDIGLALARALHPHIAAVTPIADRGVMTASFAVCRNPAIPSCLLELDFITCPEGEDAIQQPEQQRRVAEAVCAGLHDWLGGK
jgi:N-acetylmuramoyl-L-alanine amidase